MHSSSFKGKLIKFLKTKVYLKTFIKKRKMTHLKDADINDVISLIRN